MIWFFLATPQRLGSRFFPKIAGAVKCWIPCFYTAIHPDSQAPSSMRARGLLTPNRTLAFLLRFMPKVVRANKPVTFRRKATLHSHHRTSRPASFQLGRFPTLLSPSTVPRVFTGRTPPSQNPANRGSRRHRSSYDPAR